MPATVYVVVLLPSVVSINHIFAQPKGFGVSRTSEARNGFLSAGGIDSCLSRNHNPLRRNYGDCSPSVPDMESIVTIWYRESGFDFESIQGLS
jgi:hypothetical protein